MSNTITIESKALVQDDVDIIIEFIDLGKAF